jgi:hypothetical protein
MAEQNLCCRKLDVPGILEVTELAKFLPRLQKRLFMYLLAFVLVSGIAAGGSIANLTITPQSGSFDTYGVTDPKPVWLDITSITWNNTGTHHKQWMENSSTLGLATTLHTVGDLEADKHYYVSVDSNLGQNISGANGTTCNSGVCDSNSQGEIAFTYSGGYYSVHTFDVVEGL